MLESLEIFYYLLLTVPVPHGFIRIDSVTSVIIKYFGHKIEFLWKKSRYSLVLHFAVDLTKNCLPFFLAKIFTIVIFLILNTNVQNFFIGFCFFRTIRKI
jgi:hypothetical protein